jgi:hypothetical protein
MSKLIEPSADGNRCYRSPAGLWKPAQPDEVSSSRQTPRVQLPAANAAIVTLQA